MRRILFTLIFTLLAAFSFSQVAQDCGAIDCPGRCGRYIDQNGDGFCDRGRLSATVAKPAPVQETTSTIADEQPPKEAKNTEPKTNAATTPKTETNKQNQQIATQNVSTPQEDVVTTEITSTENEPEAETLAPIKTKSPYSLILITCLTVGGYLFTDILVKINKMKKATHHKIWNFVLLITGLVSCLLGFFLVIQINYNLKMDWLWTVKLYHVQFGIAMTIVAIIHILWHINYWKTYFRHKSN